MTPFNQNSYLEDLAKKHKQIRHSKTDSHFHIISSVMNLEEFQAAMLNCDGVQVLSVNLDDLSLIGENQNTLSDSIFYTYWIVKQALAGDPESKNEARETCKAIARNFVGRMRKDSLEMLQGMKEKTTLSKLNPVTITIRAYEMPVGDNYIGVQVNYRIEPPTSCINDNGVWTD